MPIGRSALPGIRLPANGPRSVLIKRRIISGVPAALTVWVSSAEAYAEVQFDDDDPSMNEALLSALKTEQSAIESAFGEPLEWRGPEAGGLMTKRTKVVTPKVSIGDRASPTTDGLNALADYARRLVSAVQPHLRVANDAATAAIVELESEAEAVDDEESATSGQEIGVQAPTTSEFSAGQTLASDPERTMKSSDDINTGV